jgi:hypothetical protein
MKPTTGAIARPFLTTRWLNLAMVTYAVPDELLLPHLPPGLELDRRDGQTFASLVAFEFQDTRVLGISWPGYHSFPELNLRFYVRCGPQRGVVFIREYAPKRLVCWIANLLYAEHYAYAPLQCTLCDRPDAFAVEYRLRWAGRDHRIALTGRQPPMIPVDGTVEHFFKEQRWGFGADRRGRLVRFEVSHPPWAIYPLTQCEVNLDWGTVYGPEWRVLQGARPYAAMLVAGSEVRMSHKRTLPSARRSLLHRQRVGVAGHPRQAARPVRVGAGRQRA